MPPSLPIAMRRGKWKLFSNFEFDRYELYDLENDISEQQDVAATQAQVVRDMGARLRAWWGQFADKVDVKAERTRVPTPTPEELEQRYYKN